MTRRSNSTFLTAYALVLAATACDLSEKNIGNESDAQSEGSGSDEGGDSSESDGDGNSESDGGDVPCTPGDTKPLDCNTCTCIEGGEWVCTEIGCNPEPPPADPFAGPLVVICNDAVIEASLPFEISDVAITGDTLELTASYGGGCTEHEFGGCWDGLWAESDPVQTSITVVHRSEPDPCEAYLSDSLALDLTPLRENYQASYQTEHGTIALGITGFGDVTYTF